MTTEKNFEVFLTEYSVTKAKRPLTHWEKVVSTCITDIGLVSLIYGHFLMLEGKRPALNRNIDKRHEQTIHKRM